MRTALLACICILVALATIATTTTNALRVGAVQTFPVTSNSNPQTNVDETGAATTLLMAQAIANSKGPIDLFTLPEFLFMPGQEYVLPGVCSGKGNNASGSLRNVCYPVPPVGSDLGCADGLALTTPPRLIACPLLGRAPNTTISINMCEKVEGNGTLYNTNVVVRGGKVVAVYRKYHPFFAECFSKPSLELVTFNVSGTKFGIFTCFDILFKDPKMDLIAMGVKHFSYSVAFSFGLAAVELFSAENQVTVVTGNSIEGQSAVVVNGKAIVTTPKSHIPYVAVTEI